MTTSNKAIDFDILRKLIGEELMSNDWQATEKIVNIRFRKMPGIITITIKDNHVSVNMDGFTSPKFDKLFPLSSPDCQADLREYLLSVKKEHE